MSGDEYVVGGMVGTRQTDGEFYAITHGDACLIHPSNPTECARKDHDHSLPATFADQPDVGYLDVQLGSWYGHGFDQA